MGLAAGPGPAAPGAALPGGQPPDRPPPLARSPPRRGADAAPPDGCCDGDHIAALAIGRRMLCNNVMRWLPGRSSGAFLRRRRPIGAGGAGSRLPFGRASLGRCCRRDPRRDPRVRPHRLPCEAAGGAPPVGTLRAGQPHRRGRAERRRQIHAAARPRRPAPAAGRADRGRWAAWRCCRSNRRSIGAFRCPASTRCCSACGRSRGRSAPLGGTRGRGRKRRWPRWGSEASSVGRSAAVSAGQFQRVLFARLLLQDAPVILLDEPFNAVDARTAADLLGDGAALARRGPHGGHRAARPRPGPGRVPRNPAARPGLPRLGTRRPRFSTAANRLRARGMAESWAADAEECERRAAAAAA